MEQRAYRTGGIRCKKLSGPACGLQYVCCEDCEEEHQGFCSEACREAALVASQS